jgi:NitT/TauT family transport system permease protein
MSGAIGAYPAPIRRRRGAELVDGLRRYLPAIIAFLIVVAAWEVISSSSSRRIIPPPSSIWAAMARESDLLLRSARATFTEAIGGLIIGTLAGLFVGFATARWAAARDIMLPIAIGASTIPLIAIAPIINNVTRGLVEVQPAQLELMRSYAATETEVLRKVRLPNMLPFLFTALKVATSLAFIGAIVGEYFGGTSDVIGQMVLTSMSSGSFSLAWAGIIIGALGAIATYLVVSLSERVLIPWHTALRDGGS